MIKKEQSHPADGIYMELFAMKDGIRYNAKILDLREATLILTNGLMSGIENLWEDKRGDLQ